MFVNYRNLFILMFGIFAVLNTELGIIGILPQLAEVTQVSISQAGYFISVFALTVTFIGPIFTLFALRLNAKMAFLIAQSLLLFANVLAILFPHYWIIMIGRFLGGLGHPLFFTLALSYGTYTMPLEKRNQAMAILLSGVNFAFIIGFPVIALLVNNFGWQTGFLFSIAIHMITILGIIIYIPKKIPKQFKDTQATQELSFKSFKDKGFIIGLPVLVASFTAMFISYSYFSPYLRDIFSITKHDLTLYLIVFGLFGFIGNLITSLIPVKKVILGFSSYLVLFIGTLLLVYFNIQNLPIMILIALWGFLQSGNILLGQLWFNTNKRTNVEAVNSMLVSGSNLGITLGSAIGGAIIANLGIGFIPLFSVSIFLLVILGIYLNTKFFRYVD